MCSNGLYCYSVVFLGIFVLSRWLVIFIVGRADLFLTVLLSGLVGLNVVVLALVFEAPFPAIFQ